MWQRRQQQLQPRLRKRRHMQQQLQSAATNHFDSSRNRILEIINNAGVVHIMINRETTANLQCDVDVKFDFQQIQAICLPQ